MAFAAPIAAYSATQKNPNRFATIFRFGITPLFLFSGHVLPDQLAAAGPPGRRLADAALPRRGADPRACRWARSGEDPAAAVVHIVYLTTLVVVGAWLATRTVERRLVDG